MVLGNVDGWLTRELLFVHKVGKAYLVWNWTISVTFAPSELPMPNGFQCVRDKVTGRFARNSPPGTISNNSYRPATAILYGMELLSDKLRVTLFDCSHRRLRKSIHYKTWAHGWTCTCQLISNVGVSLVCHSSSYVSSTYMAFPCSTIYSLNGSKIVHTHIGVTYGLSVVSMCQGVCRWIFQIIDPSIEAVGSNRASNFWFRVAIYHTRDFASKISLATFEGESYLSSGSISLWQISLASYFGSCAVLRPSIQSKLLAAVPDGIREIISELRQREEALEAFITSQDIWKLLSEIAIQHVSGCRNEWFPRNLHRSIS
jgi:hypothetical protein